MEQAKLATCLAWINCLQKGKSPIDALEKNKMDNLIIYGVADLGEALVNEVIRKGHKIAGVTDRIVKNGNYEYHGIPVLAREKLSEDPYCNYCIVVTSMTSYQEIKKQLLQEGVKNVVSLLEILKSVE